MDESPDSDGNLERPQLDWEGLCLQEVVRAEAKKSAQGEIMARLLPAYEIGNAITILNELRVSSDSDSRK